MESGMFQAGKVLLSSLISTFGTVYIAANSVANTLNNIGWTVVGSLSTVLLTVVGQCIGAGETQQAKAYTKRFLKLGSIMVVVLFGSVFLLRHPLVRMFNFGPETLKEAAYFTGAGALFTIASVYGLAFVPVAAFRAAGDVRYAMILAIGSMFTFRVGLSYLLHYVWELGLLSVWIGMWADWTFRSVVNAIHFHRGKWLTKKVI